MPLSLLSGFFAYLRSGKRQVQMFPSCWMALLSTLLLPVPETCSVTAQVSWLKSFVSI
jgi:hypothetical protein